MPQITKPWLLATTWILSVPAIGGGLLSIIFYFSHHGTSFSWLGRRNLAFGVAVWIFLLGIVGLGTAVLATFFLLAGWISEKLTLSAKVSGTIAVCLAWLGELTLLKLA